MPGLFILIAALQAAPIPERFSILVPVGNEPCDRTRRSNDEIIVCGDPIPSQTLPLSDQAVADRPVPSNPNRTGVAALAAESSPCATLQRGCQVGFGPPIAPIIAAGIGVIKRTLAKKPDKTNRVPIVLD